MGPVADWREDIDALQFATGSGGACMVHRLAFRRLVGFTPQRADCMAYFASHAPAFGAAAANKIALRRIAPGRNLHLTSRDIRRQLDI
jgi:hypothetical protein